MFKFGFSTVEMTEGDGDDGDNTRLNSELSWFPAVEISVTDESISHNYNDKDCWTEKILDGVDLQLIRSENLLENLKKKQHENIIKAESQHSDLLPAVYEGGLKVWECSYDLVKYLITQNIVFEKLKVLDLGCGAGILGIVALLKKSVVHFQDYNREVIELLTIPNVLLNLEDRKLINKRAKFYSGDWAAFNELCTSEHDSLESQKYDIILSSETIYNSDNHNKLLQVFKQQLKINGTGYIAGKTYYFGVGGSMREFERLINQDNTFCVEHVWKSTDNGLQREIIKLTRYISC